MSNLIIAILISTAAPWTPVPNDATDVETITQSWSCSTRRLCTQISTCEEARWYLQQCRWGYKLDGDSDGIPCEKLCGSAP